MTKGVLNLFYGGLVIIAITLQAGPFSISSQSTSWHHSVKSEHYEQSSQQITGACHLTCQLGTLMVLPLDNVKYARGQNRYIFTPYQLNQGRELMHTSCKALTSAMGNHWNHTLWLFDKAPVSCTMNLKGISRNPEALQSQLNNFHHSWAIHPKMWLGNFLKLGPSRKGGGPFLSLYRFRGLVLLLLLLLPVKILGKLFPLAWRDHQVITMIEPPGGGIIPLWEGPQLLLAKVKHANGRIGIFLLKLNCYSWSRYGSLRFVAIPLLLDSGITGMWLQFRIWDCSYVGAIITDY